MAIDILERIHAAIAGGHELNHAHRRVNRMPGRFVKIRPAAVVGLNFICQTRHKSGWAHAAHNALNACDTDVIDHGYVSSMRL